VLVAAEPATRYVPSDRPCKDAPDMASLILTVIGPDRPGLVRALAGAVAARDGSWLESRMARLAGQFAGIVLVEAPDSLAEDLHKLESEGLRITVQSATTRAQIPSASPRLALEVVGNDRPGIVRDVSQVLAASLVNIEELTTHVVSGSFSGETLFRVTAFVRAPDAAAVDAVRAGLEQLGNELMVDIQPAAE
jgi:glycine cleavage system regulatory protein